MSDDPGDGARKLFNAVPESGGAGDKGNEGAPDEQGSDQLAAFGKRASRQD